MFNYIDNLLNSITMYRLVMYGLLALAGIAIILSAAGLISYSPLTLFTSLFTLTASGYAANWICAKLYKVASNFDSVIITSLILFFVMYPAATAKEFGALVAASSIAMASKYVLAIHKRHIFNPAALAAFVVSVSGLGFAVWWIGTPYMLPLVLIGGLLIVRKNRRMQLFLSAVAASFVVIAIVGLINTYPLTAILWQHTISWPIIFFASVMITEPITMPPTTKLRVIYGLFVGGLSSLPFSLGPIHNTPEFSLLLGNIFAYTVSLKRRLVLTLNTRTEIAKDTYEFTFKVDPPLKYTPGQYLEWTLPHAQPDDRGIRRYFTISSSPTEPELKIGVKFNPAKSSSFKSHLLNMSSTEYMYAGQLGGDFTLNGHENEKLVFMAGGIGITPFRSMLQQLLDTNRKQDIVLFYSNRTSQDIAYTELLKRAEQQINLRTVLSISDEPYPANWPGETGFVNIEMIKRHVPDFTERTFYLSGPNAMVEAYKKMLINIGVSRSKIITDYFPGFA
jgi:ferredoxin-NADP reductase